MNIKLENIIVILIIDELQEKIGLKQFIYKLVDWLADIYSNLRELNFV